ncbi:MAG: DUF1624 domain-containing protein [Acidobacteria bacterium]|nr:DUF1624 domain-containing protein [Acidobacteriota bacterium]
MSTSTSPVTSPAHELSFCGSRDAAGAVPAVSARSVFVDLARAGAILMMLQGHTLHVVLASEARTGTAVYLWSFLRGLTSCTFLLLSGFVFTVATQRRWTDHLSSRAAIGRRFRRFGFFLLLGYVLHFPMAKIAHLYGMSAERWQSFLIVDILQCIAVTLAGLQVLVLLARTPRHYTIGAAVGGAAIVALTPAMWRIDWSGQVPLAVAAYLSPSIGSLFPLFPWGAYILLGAVLGAVYVRSGRTHLTRFANHVMLGGGAGMATLALVGAGVPLQPFGDTDFWSTSPNQFLLRSGLVLLILGLLAHISRLLSRPPFVVQALAHESLTIYAVHLCLVYGSVWNAGLRQLVGPTLTLLPALAYVAAVWASMMVLASAWYWCKERQPGVAQWVRVGAAGLLLGRLL